MLPAQTTPGGAFSRWRRGIAAKVYCFAILALLAVSALSGASIYFSKVTENAAKSLYGEGFLGVMNSSRLEQLIEQHRRIVESMPSEVDRLRIQKENRDLGEIRAKLTILLDDIISRSSDPKRDSLERKIAAQLPALFEAAEKVVFYAHEFAQDRAAEWVQVYMPIADQLQVLTRTYENARLLEAQSHLLKVSSAAASLAIWVLLSALAAIVLIGPIGLATMRSVLTRLRRITQTMTKLAQNDTSTVVPSRGDRDEIGDMARAVEVFKEHAIRLSEREGELELLNGRIDVALNNMTHGLCMFDANQKVIVSNAVYRRMYGLPDDLVQPGTPLWLIESHRLRIGNAASGSPERLVTPASHGAEPELSLFTQALMDGRTILVSQRPMPDGGFVAVHEDITERRRAEAKIAHLARHDMLTNLPNRVLFREHLESALLRVSPGVGCAVHCLDLDHFKTVNDTLGHPVGDELLKAVAGRLSEVVTTTDFVARIGGDEFAIVQEGVERPEQSSQLARRIIELVNKPYDIDGRHIIVGTSVGIAVAPNDGDDPDQLLKNADMALYLAKSDGRGTHRYFEEEMDNRLQLRRELEIDLRSAITNGEFELYYQPIICLESDAVTGFEALIRWNHPTRGQISPAQFIPVAEEMGLILPLGEWILRTACARAATWPEAIGVSVNLSAAQFRGRNLSQIVVNSLASSGLPANRLELEITETALLQNEAHTFTVLRQIQKLGVRISLDDFGTGYSSLAYLRSFPFDKIKIDRSFVRDMLIRKDCRAIVCAISALAQSLGITTVAEGIETVEQLQMVKADRCQEAQGYLFAKPMPEPKVVEFLATRGIIASAA
jgi:diguanylate cyclase (GGDEF)-like protein